MCAVCLLHRNAVPTPQLLRSGDARPPEQSAAEPVRAVVPHRVTEYIGGYQGV